MLTMVKDTEAGIGYKPDFMDFYAIYPRHEARKDALKAWSGMPEHDQLAALVAIVDWRRVWMAQGREAQHTPLPATWLRGERWTDELPTVARQVSSASHVMAAPVAHERGVMPESVRAALAKLRGKG